MRVNALRSPMIVYAPGMPETLCPKAKTAQMGGFAKVSVLS
jgi:hypothetical protein